MLDDPMLDALMVFQAVATLLLAFQVHSLSRRSAQSLTCEHTHEDKPEESKLSETDEYLRWLTKGNSESKSEPVAKPLEESKPRMSENEQYVYWLTHPESRGETVPIKAEEQKETQTTEKVRETSIMPHSKSEPFNPEALTDE